MRGNNRCLPPTYWYLAQTKPRQEQTALQNLERQAYLVNKLPRVRALKRSSRPASREGTQILFPGYIFFAPSRIDQSIAPVRSILGVSRVVRFGLEPAQITDRLLTDVLAFVKQTEEAPGGLLAHLNQIATGASVLVRDGPFSGLSGLVSQVASDRVLVLLEIMGKEQTLGFELGQLDRA